MNPLFHSSSALTENVKTPPMTRQTLLVARPPIFVFCFSLMRLSHRGQKSSRCEFVPLCCHHSHMDSHTNQFIQQFLSVNDKNPSLPRRFSAPMHFPHFLFLFTLIPEIALPQEGDFLVFSLEFHLRKIYCPHGPPPPTTSTVCS